MAVQLGGVLDEIYRAPGWNRTEAHQRIELLTRYLCKCACGLPETVAESTDDLTVRELQTREHRARANFITKARCRYSSRC